jgi:hypothetical protein
MRRGEASHPATRRPASHPEPRSGERVARLARQFPLFAVAAVAISACHTSAVGPASSATPDSLSIRHDIEYLASPRLAGRLTGTPGNDSAAAYLARRYASFGLKPTSPDFIQRFVARPAAHAGQSVLLPTQNVVAMLPGRDSRLRNEYVVIGAHFDHLGTSTENALDPNVHAARLGADDNASGSAAVVELARLFSRNPARRSIIFVNFSGEEEGVLGSQYFVEHMPVATDSVIAMLNFDMVGRMRDDKLIVLGAMTAKEFPALLTGANTESRFRLTATGDGYGPSDHYSFYAKGIPVLHFFTDSHEDYHKASDTPDKVNAAGEARIVAFAEHVARTIADNDARPTYVFAVPPAPTTSRDGGGVYFGSIPDMAGSDTPGLRLTGVTAGSPADLGGVKSGDVIVEFGGKPVKDLYEYSDALYSHQPGDEVAVVVLRGSQRLTLKVKLTKRGG